MPDNSTLACEVGCLQYWTTHDYYIFRTLNKWSACAEGDLDVRDLPQFKRWDHIIEAFLKTLHDENIVPVLMNTAQLADEITIRRRLVMSFLKEYAEESGKRRLALDLLRGNGFSFDEAYDMLRPTC